MSSEAVMDYIAAYKELKNYKAAEEQSGYKLLEKYPHNQWYVYALIDPANNRIFYIGKGIDGRVLKHEEQTIRGNRSNQRNRRKTAYVAKVINSGKEVIKRILYTTYSEEAALAVEEQIIKALKYEGLTNIIGGYSGISDRMKRIAQAASSDLQRYKDAWQDI